MLPLAIIVEFLFVKLNNMGQKRIIDKRTKEKFMIDDEYLNGMARLVGHQGTLVYFSLCRHVNKNQECFPSITLMSEEHGVSKDTIKRGVKKLQEKNVISVGKKRTKSGQWLNNTYTLLDKSVWNYSQRANSTVGSQGANFSSPGSKYNLDGGANSTTKETHSEGNIYKETHTPKSKDLSNKNNQVAEIFKVFEVINPTINYGHTTNRKSCKELIDKFGFKKICNTAKYAVEIQNQKYSPTITTPYQLKIKLGELKAYYQKNNNKRKIIKL